MKHIDSRVFEELIKQKYSLETVAHVDTLLSVRLRDLWLNFGSDKGSRHGYEIFYSSIPFDSCDSRNVLEIGIGTNVVEAKSSMGVNGAPGASLLAWKSYLPEYNIYGADIEPNSIAEALRLALIGKKWDICSRGCSD